MASKQDYIAGLITLTNGSPNFTGTGTGWAAASVGIGDTIFDLPGTPYQGVINTITNDFAGTLTRNWDGPSLAGVPYRIRFQPDGSRYPAAVVQLIEELENGNLQAFAQLLGFANGVAVFTGPGAMEVQPKSAFVSGADYDVQVNNMAARAAYDGQATGFAVLVSNVGTAFGPENNGRSAIFSKNSNTSGDWSNPAFVTGGIGLTPDVDATVAMLPPGSAPTVVPTPIPGGVRLDFSLPEASGFNPAGTYNAANAYNQDDVVLHNRSSFIAIQSVPVGQSPSSVYPPVDTAYWQVLVVAGQNGTGTGDVVGPASSVNDRIVTFNGVSGKSVKDSGLTIQNIRPQPRVFTKPAGFVWPDVAGGQVSSRTLMAVLDMAGRYSLKFPFWAPPNNINARKRYYVSSSGNDSNTGDTESLPLLTMNAALAKSDAAEIVIGAGTYFNVWSATSPATTQCTITVRGEGKATFVTGSAPSGWTLTSGGIYTVSVVGLATTINVVSRKFYGEYGQPLHLTNYATLAAMGSNPGWTTDGGATNVYVRLPDSSAPANGSLYLLTDVAGPAITAGSRYYISDCEFYGGDDAFTVNTSAANAAFDRCAFYGSAGSGVDADNVVQGIFFRECIAANNRGDGFNYHDSSPTTPCIAIEMDCIAVSQGVGGVATSCNGSSIHDDGRIIRVNGFYGGGRGSSIADIGNSKSWNLGITSFNSLIAGLGSFHAGNPADITEFCEMWLDGCISYGSDVDIKTETGGGAVKVYTRNLVSNGVFNIAPGTSMVAY